MQEWVRALAAIALAVGLAVALRWWAARPRLPMPGVRRRGPRRLEALDRLPLSAQHTLHLVRVGDRALLIGVHPGGCSLLESLPAAPLAAGGSAAPEEAS